MGRAGVWRSGSAWLAAAVFAIAACDDPPGTGPAQAPTQVPGPGAPTPSPQPGDADAGLRQFLVGTWAYSYSSPGGGYISRTATFRADGTYEYESMVAVSTPMPGGESTGDDLIQSDSGTWEVSGQVLRTRSRMTGEMAEVMIQFDPAGVIYANGEAWTRQ